MNLCIYVRFCPSRFCLQNQPEQPAIGEPRRKMAPARCRPVVSPLLLLTLLACVTAAAGWSVCDGATCGKGNCTEEPGIIPTYKCECDPGWSRAIGFIPISPCVIPSCTKDSSCFNLSLGPPKGIPITDICVAVNCGPGGTCKHGNDGFFSYTCECQPGYVNVLNITAFPCVKNCAFGMDCTALGLGPPPSPPPSPAPSGNHDSSGAPASPPPSPKGNATSLGSVALWSLIQLLLLVSMAVVQVF